MTTEKPPDPGATPGGNANPGKEESKKTEGQPNDATKLADELKAAEARIAELNKENQKHRTGKKELEELAAKQAKALAILTGKEEQPDPAALEKKATDSKIRTAYLKAAFVSEAAKEMHDAGFAFDALAKEFSEVKVDLDTGAVDTEAIRTKLEEVKKVKTFLFNTSQPPGTKPPPGNLDGNGAPASGDPYKKWLAMKTDPLRSGEAQKFYSENRAAILANMK